MSCCSCVVTQTTTSVGSQDHSMHHVDGPERVRGPDMGGVQWPASGFQGGRRAGAA